MWVVKLGGSLQSFAGLRGWVDLIAAEGGGRIVLVPGGGRFADAVRALQRELHFDDRTAHHMALSAMEQFGTMLASRTQAFTPAHSEAQIGAALARGQVAVWMPHDMVTACPGIPASWDWTSDSLALWLARLLGAECLLLIKSAALPESATAEALAAAGLVDAMFPALARDCDPRISWLDRNQTERLRAGLRTGNPDDLPTVTADKEKRRPGPQPGARRESGQLDSTKGWRGP